MSFKYFIMVLLVPTLLMCTLQAKPIYKQYKKEIKANSKKEDFNFIGSPTLFLNFN